MSMYQTRPEPGISLGDRLERLHHQIGTLAGRLKDGIAGAVGAAVAEALRDLLRGLLGVGQGPSQPAFRHQGWTAETAEPERWGEPRHPGYGSADPDSWGGDDPDDLDEPDQPEAGTGPGRWQAAGDAAVRAGAWWLGRQTGRRPGLTTLLVAGATGVLTLFAGPTAVLAFGVLAAVAGTVATADTARSLAAGLRALVGR